MNSLSYSKGYFTLAILFCFGFATLSSQSVVSDQAVYRVYDAMVSRENTGLYNGPQLIDEHPSSWDQSHIYLESATFQNSTLVYSGQMYIDVPLRYDLIGDNVSIRSDDYLSLFKIKVDPIKITSFSTHDRHFIKLTDTGLDLSGNDFFEIAYVGKTLSLFIKHLKRIKRETIDKVLQQRFISENYYLFWQNDTYLPIYSLKDFKKISPSLYTQIREFYKLNRSLYKTNPDEFMIKLGNFLDINQNS